MGERTPGSQLMIPRHDPRKDGVGCFVSALQLFERFSLCADRGEFFAHFVHFATRELTIAQSSVQLFARVRLSSLSFEKRTIKIIELELKLGTFLLERGKARLRISHLRIGHLGAHLRIVKLLFQRIERGLNRFAAIGERILFSQDRVDLLAQFVTLIYLLVIVLFNAIMIGYRVIIGSFNLLELRGERFKILSSTFCLDLLVFERTNTHGKFLFVGLATFAQHDALRVDGLSDRTHAAIIISEC